MSNYLVIGGSGGIGREIANQVSLAGHRVIATYCNHKPDNEYPNIDFHYLDVLAENEIFDFIPAELAGFVYCPGSINLKPFEKITPQKFETDYRLQVTGAVKLLQAALPALKKMGNASIVLFSTVAVQIGLSFHTQVAASKGAIEGLTRALAAEYGPKIRVNCIAPSLTDTALAAHFLNTEQKKEVNAAKHPLKRIGSTEDIANMCAFLLSDKASWVTGQVFHVDGGMSSIKVNV